MSQLEFPPRAPQTYDLRSQALDETYSVQVAFPLSALPGAKGRFAGQQPGPPPLFLMLDGEFGFPVGANVSRMMQMNGDLPPHFVAAISYKSQDPGYAMRRRMRDLTPIKAKLPPPFEDLEQGRGPEFEDFILMNVLPTLLERANAGLGRRYLSGGSMGGLLAANMLLDHPDAFDGYGMTSPYLSFGESVTLAKARTAMPAGDGRRVFLSYGALEPLEPHFPSMATDVTAFADLLVAGSYLPCTHEFSGEVHHSVGAASISRGLRVLVGGASADGAQVKLN